MTLAGLAKRGRHAALLREATYQRVLLAVHILADDDGLECRATNAEIARECGHSVGAVSRSLAEMRRRGVIESFDKRNGLSYRTIILLDHERAGDLLDQYDRTVRINHRRV